MGPDLFTESSLRDAAEQALAILRKAGFEHAQATASWTAQEELNVAHGRPSLLRSTEGRKLSLTGIVDGRRASAELDDFSVETLGECAAQLFADAVDAPQDAANAVSSGQRVRIEQGPQQAEARLLADKVVELLAFREATTPTMMVDEGTAAHTLLHSHACTTGGSELSTSLGWYSMSVLGSAREGGRSSSFNLASGTSHDLRAAPAADFFGLGDMFRDTAAQIETRPLAAKFVGQLVLGPRADADLVAWLLSQVGDLQLISGNSLYREHVGAVIASPHLSLRSRFGAPGVAGVSADAFVAAPVELLREGRLLTLAPSLYGSRKTGLPHVPTAASGWELAAGGTERADLVGGVAHGALVGRLSMGMPAPNGDFSASIKNSVEIVAGRTGDALSETMISGNIARMLHDISGVSRERIDSGALLAPWLRIDDIQFS
jgi:PmbA protein